MAKVRVYELAKELNMDNKELVEKLKAGGIDISNYMSTLDEQTAARAKDLVTKKVSEIVEEKRIKPTVIRRRKKTVSVAKAVIEEVQEEIPVKPAAPEVSTKLPVESKETIPERAEEIISDKLEAVEKEGVVEEPAVEAKPARESAEEIEVVAEEVKGLETPVKEVEKEEPPVSIEDKVPVERPAKERKRSEREAKPRGKEKKKAKKKKGEQPAKIIKLPEEGPLKGFLDKKKEPLEPEMLVPVASPKVVPAAPDVEKKEKISKKKKEKKKSEIEGHEPKGSIKQRKIEVFERADLYEGRRGKPKKKDAKGRDVPKRQKQTEITLPRAIKRRIKVQEKVTVGELAKAMGVKGTELIRKLMGQGVMATLNYGLDFETASLISDEFGYELELDQIDIESLAPEVEDKIEDLVGRPPVVTIMGHVDHGKTSLLDYIRKSNIIGEESGGITQHIGAYYVERDGGDVVFLDTPGHEAFTAMRARGAKVTDLIVLVVAADDGVMPQTREAVNHARAAGIHIIVAVNKIDKANANIDKVRRELADLELVPEEWGGETIFGYISAKTGEGVDELMELILLQSEILELKANPKKPAKGAIIEAKLDKNRGALATVLIKDGTLKQGDYFICGDFFGRVRAMLNSRGKRIISAGPSEPIEIYGISGVPMAGDEFLVVQDEKKARQFIDQRQAQMKAREVGKRGIVSLDDLYEKIKEGEIKELNIVIKTDVQGSLEALSESLIKQSTTEVKIKIIHSSTGSITETDVMLASASSAIVIGFNVRANQRVTEIAEKEHVDIRYYDVIYNVIQDIRLAMAGLLEPVYKEKAIGRVEVKETFHVPKVGVVAGCYVTDGYVERNSNVRLVRDGVVIFDGKLTSLRRFKDDVKEVQTGYECGIGLENYQDLKPGDILEAYQMEELEAKL